MPFPCGFRLCLSHLIYTVRPCLIHTYNAVPLPCHECRFESDLSEATAGERHVMCELASAVQRRHVGDLPAFGFFRLPRGVPGSFIRSIPISNAGGQCETKQYLSWTRRGILFWCKDKSACIIYSTKINKFIN
jgi:hypothetical protein